MKNLFSSNLSKIRDNEGIKALGGIKKLSEYLLTDLVKGIDS